MEILNKISGLNMFLILAVAVLLFVVAIFGYGFLDLKAQQDLATEQADIDAEQENLEALLAEADFNGFERGQLQDVININNEYYEKGFVTLPILQDGSFVEVKFYTEQGCVEEIQRILQEAGVQ